MSQVAIELIKRSEDAYNRRDLDAYLTCFHADAELHPFASGVEGETYHGHDEIRRFWEGLDEVFESVEIHNEEFRDLGDRVLAIGWWRLRGKESGAEVKSKAGWIVEARGDKIAYLRSYGDPTDALAAAGVRDRLSEFNDDPRSHPGRR
jgi:ketosteroid isomerase-like protein